MLELTHCTNEPCYASTETRRFCLLSIILSWLRSLSGEQKNQDRSAENHTSYFDFSVNA